MKRVHACIVAAMFVTLLCLVWACSDDKTGTSSEASATRGADNDGETAATGSATTAGSGAARYEVKVTLDREQLAARGLTARDVQDAITRESQGGALEQGPGALESLVVRRTDDRIVRLTDVARIEVVSADKERTGPCKISVLVEEAPK